MQSAATSKRILVVDDQPENIHILIENLQSQYEILFATTGQKALDIVFSHHRPDLILLDIKMPGMNGYEVLARLKADSASRDIPVIFITAQDQETDETTGFRLGAVDYIIKPFRIPVVEARISAALRLEEEMRSRRALAQKLETLNSQLEERVKEKTGELRQAHEQLKLSEKKYRTIFENAIEGIFQSTPDGRLLNASPSMARILGHGSQQELMAATHSVTSFYANQEERNRFRDALLEKGEISDFETQWQKLDGEKIWVMISAKVIRNGFVSEPYFQGFVIDITEKKRAGELELANTRLRELDSLKSALMSTASHDLRSPMTAIMGYNELVKIDFIKYFTPLTADGTILREKASKIIERLEIIHTEGDRLIRLVNDFLDLSKFESGCTKWHDIPVLISEVVEHAVKVIKGQLTENQTSSFTVSLSPNLPTLLCDPDRIMQVIVNLLSNAVKFAGSGQVTLQASAIDNDRIEIRVSDTGPGVPEEEKEKIFNKFYQVRAHRPTDRKHPLGTGLGLAICKQIVTHYGGTIWVESEPGCGSTFIFQLPTGRSDIHRRLAKTA